jgi:hypothetical protein
MTANTLQALIAEGHEIDEGPWPASARTKPSTSTDSGDTR